MKIGLDIHGVIDTNPVFFAKLTAAIGLHSQEWYPAKYQGSHEVHVMTGSSLKDGQIEAWLKKHQISYTHLFSISDYLKEIGKPELPHSTEKNPWFYDGDWNRAKGIYAKENKLDLVLDDMDEYMTYFKTPVARFYSKDRG